MIRALVIAVNTAVYLFALDPSVGYPWLAWTIIAVASVYAVGVIFRLHRWLARFLSGWLTTVTDSVLITGWIIATGGIHSPFYLLWYVSLVAIAFRFGMRETLSALGLYVVLYAGLVAAMAQLPAHLIDLLVRLAYAGFVGVLAALLAGESARLWLSKADLQRISEKTGSLVADVDMDMTLRQVLDSTREFVRADRGAIYLLDKENGLLKCAYAQGLSDSWIHTRSQSYEKLPSTAVLRGKPLLHVHDALTDPRLDAIRTAVKQEGIRTYAVFPLIVDGERIGLLSLYRDRVEPFSEWELEMAEHLAQRAGTTISNARLVKELSESEKRLQKVLSNAPVVLFATDKNGVVTVYEGDATKSIGLDPKDVMGRAVEDLFAGNERIQRNLDRALRGEEFASEVEFNEKLFTAHYAPMRDEEGAVDGVMGVAVDVTKQRKAEVEEKQHKIEQAELEHLREIDQFKTLFINTAAHELRTPLTPIKVQLHLLRSDDQEGLSKRQRHSITVLERNIDRLGHLVEDILEGARIQAGRLSATKKPIELERVIGEAVESFRDPAKVAGVDLETRLAPDLIVPADAKRLIQVLFNLLSNALKFTPEGGTITVETGADDQWAYIRVQDTGAGLTKGQASRLFRPFSQVHDPMTTVRGGPGWVSTSHEASWICMADASGVRAMGPARARRSRSLYLWWRRRPAPMWRVRTGSRSRRRNARRRRRNRKWKADPGSFPRKRRTVWRVGRASLFDVPYDRLVSLTNGCRFNAGLACSVARPLAACCRMLSQRGPNWAARRP